MVREFFHRSRLSFLLFRVGAILGFAVIGLSFSDVGPNRFLFAAYCAFFVAPLSALVEAYFPVIRFGWSQPVLDCCCCALAAQIVPEVWSSIFMVGLLTANSRLLIPTRTTFFAILLAHVILLSGMLVSALNFGVAGWQVPFFTVLVSLPAVLFYAHREAVHLLDEREHVNKLQSLAMVSQGVAHDFNNVLTGVAVNAKLAERQLLPDHPARESLQSVLEASSYAQQLTDQLLALAGKKSGESARDVVREVESIVRLIRSVIPNGIQVSVEVKGEIPSLDLDRTRLQQVVMNLLLNAVEAVSPPSTVFLELAHDGSDVTIDIVDKGKGIRQSDLVRIFEPFFSSKSDGTGIGLATVQHLVAEAGGTICVETKVGRGTRMSVRLPVVVKSETKSEPAVRDLKKLAQNSAATAGASSPAAQ